MQFDFFSNQHDDQHHKLGGLQLRLGRTMDDDDQLAGEGTGDEEKPASCRRVPGGGRSLELRSLRWWPEPGVTQLRRPRPARRSSGHSSGEQQGGAPASSRERSLVNICNICHCNTFS